MIMYTNSIFFEAHLCFTLNYVLLKTVTNRLKMFLWFKRQVGTLQRQVRNHAK